MKPIELFKQSIKEGIITNFEKFGYVTPTLFFFKGGEPIMAPIPETFLENSDSKLALTEVIREQCQDATITAVAIVVETYYAKVDTAKTDVKTLEKIKSGEIKTSELDEKEDGVLLIFSTPENEDITLYSIDCDKKEISEDTTYGAPKDLKGIFTNFFTWMKN